MEPSLSRVLIVDDNRTNVAILANALHNDCQVGVASSGLEALNEVQAHRVDLVLLDIMMPEMDGYEVCRRLKKNSQTAHIPVIFITALDEMADKVRGFSLGAVDYIVKPFEIVEVRARVRTHLRLEQYRRELEAKNQALEKAQARLQFQVKELEGRDRLTHAQMSVVAVDEACATILQVVAQALEVRQAIFYRPSVDGDRLEAAALLGVGQTPAVVAAGDPDHPAAQAFRECEPRQGKNGELAVPSLYRRQALGVLWLDRLDPGPLEREVVLDTLWHLAGESALLLHAAHLAEDLERGELDVAGLLESGDEGE